MKNSKKSLTELVFILDRSGSMGGLETDTIGGFNGLVQKQKKEPGDALVTTVLFDDQYQVLHDRVNINDILPITEDDYFVRGTTALLDAIGITINRIKNAQKNIPKKEQAENVLFVITTDGMENSSKEFTYKEIKKMILQQKEKYGWEFLFLGANMDAIQTAENFGIDSTHAVNYHADKKGTKLIYEEVAHAVSSMRADGSVSESWKEQIQTDYEKREKEN